MAFAPWPACACGRRSRPRGGAAADNGSEAVDDQLDLDRLARHVVVGADAEHVAVRRAGRRELRRVAVPGQIEAHGLRHLRLGGELTEARVAQAAGDLAAGGLDNVTQRIDSL